jgi:adenylate cyclase
MDFKHPSPVALLTFVFVILGLVWGGYLGLRQMAALGSAIDSFENLTLDWRYAIAGPRPAPRGVVIVAIDDETVREAGAYPLSRSSLARVIRNVAAANPQAIAVDIAFLDAGPAEADAELVEALGATKSVVAAVGIFAPNTASASASAASIPSPSNVLWPIAEIRRAADVGLVNVATDASGIPRFVPMIYRTGDAITPSFALAAVSAALNEEPAFGPDTLRLGTRRVGLDIGEHLPIRFYGPRGAIAQISASRILRGEFAPEELRGRLVAIGATAVGVGDSFATPFDRIVPGVEIFATAATNLLAGDALVRTSRIREIDAAAAVLLPCVTVLLMAMRRALAGLVLAGVVFAVWGGLTFAAFLSGYWLSFAAPLAALAPIAIGSGGARLTLDRYAAGRLTADKAALTKFQSPVLLDHILATPGFLEQPVAQDVAALFLDLSGFTGLAETLGPLAARDLLAGFQAIVEREIAADQGFIVSFLGDGAMILFGLPEPKPDDAARAFASAKRLHAAVEAWLADLPAEAKDRLKGRIGGHFGPAVVSRLGPTHHQHITATGDTVNVASRLLEICKQRECGLVVSEALFDAARPMASDRDAANAVSLDVAIRGRAGALRILAWR